MNPALLVRFRPTGPWRMGPDSGARDQVDRIYHSDTLFSAVSIVMARLGRLAEWLAETVENPQGPAVRFTSCFPYLEETLFVVPPRSLWPPLASPKLRWKSARFVPLSLIGSLLAEESVSEGRWVIDGLSQCLLPHDGRTRPGPFRPAVRSQAARDRLSGRLAPHSIACLEFAAGAGLWTLAVFASEEARERWAEPVKSSLRLLADTGLGGERSLGWGHSQPPEFTEPPADLWPLREGAAASDSAYWLLSLFCPAPDELIDWQRGSYSLATRGGRVDSPSGSGQPKKLVRMVEEGSVLVAEAPLRGGAPNVAPDGFPHPVFRFGCPVAVPIPRRLAEVRP